MVLPVCMRHAQGLCGLCFRLAKLHTMPLVSADLFEGVTSLPPQAQRSHLPQGPSTPVTAVTAAGMEGRPLPLLAPSGPCVAEPHLRLGMCGV